MAINIKDSRTDEVARRLAKATGEKLTTAVRVSIEERWERVKRVQLRQQRATDLGAYIERARQRAVVDERSMEEILYDEDGLPA